MKNFNAYESLFKLRPYEEIAYTYYKEAGRYLTSTELYYLVKHNAGCDFSRLNSLEYKDFEKKLQKKHILNKAILMEANTHIPEYANVSVLPTFRYIDLPRHSHDFFEFICVLKGVYRHSVNGKDVLLKSGDITIIPPGVGHYIYSEPDSFGIIFEIKRDSFESVYSPLLRNGTTLAAFFTNSLYSKKPSDTVTFHCPDDAFIYETLLYMYAQQTLKKHHYANVLDGLVLTLLSYILQNYEDDIDFADESSSSERRVIAIEKYLRQNFKTATLPETAAHFKLNPTYLSNLIKGKTGYNFSYILRFLRMERAADYLQNTDMKIDEICEAVGYCDTTQFIKTFKKQYGETPSEYRKSSRGRP